MGRGSVAAGTAAQPSDAEASFAGFPSSGLATAVPNLFFSRVLPGIETPAELLVSLYLFFLHRQKRGWPRLFTRRQLLADAALMRSLANLSGLPAEEALGAGLAAALSRGTLISAPVDEGGDRVEAYLLNTPTNRKDALALSPAGLALEEPLPPASPEAEPNIFRLYEENVGGITPLIADQLKDAEERYPPRWVQEAFRQAVSLNKRSWRYIEAILRRYEAEGVDYETAGRDPEAEWLERRYAKGKRGLRLRPRTP